MSGYTKGNAIEKVLNSVEHAKVSYTRNLKVKRYLIEFINSIPEELFPKINSICQLVYSYSDSLYIGLDFPWDASLMKQVKKFLETQNEGKVSVFDADDKSRTMYTINKTLSNGFAFEVNASFYPAIQGSKCVLVPLKSHKVEKVVVDVYDRICPEGHPELFEERDGQLVYIGDAFAPALVEQNE